MPNIIVKNANVNNLKNVSVTIPLHKYIAFIGKSGSGKSTLAVDVILAGYLNNYNNVLVPVKPALFKQRATGFSKKCTLCKYMCNRETEKELSVTLSQYINNTKQNSKLTKEQLQSIMVELGIEGIPMNRNISEMSLTQYNKIRFLNLISSSDAELFIIDELGAGMIYDEAVAVSKVLKYMVDCGMTIIAIEHSLPIISASDYIVELGPKAGADGGKIVFCGNTSEYKLTVAWKIMIDILTKNIGIKQGSRKMLNIENINYHTFKNSHLYIPLEGIVTICGGMNAGKSSILDVLFRAFDKSANAWKNRDGIDGEISGKNYIRRPYIIDQITIGNNSMSTPATYTGIMNSIRNFYYTSVDNEKEKLEKSDFSYNSTGKCIKCNGTGCFETEIDNENIYLPCDECHGTRYNKKVEVVKENGLTIGDVLLSSCEELHNIYINDKKKKALTEKIGFINSVGLSYLKLGQPSGTLSGGESQRIKITKELGKKLGDRCLFILDSPAKGLHVDDLSDVMQMLKMLVAKNNSIVICENNPFFVNNCDWVIYLDGGNIEYEGVPKDIPIKLRKKLGIGVNL